MNYELKSKQCLISKFLIKENKRALVVNEKENLNVNPI